MPRKFGSVNVEIWNDPEFRKLPPAAQHLYLLLWTAPNLSFCGVHEWRPARLTKLSLGFTEQHTRTVAACLVARHFLVIDEETEEVLVRSWARFDELLKQPRLAVSYSAAYAAVYSPVLRMVLVNETKKMRQMWPDLACWKDQRVASILDHEGISAKDLPPVEDPFGPGFDHEVDPGFGLGLAQTSVNVWPSVWAPPTPAPTPTPNTYRADDAADATSTTPKKKRAKPLPESWAPNDKHRLIAEENFIRIDDEAERFRDHAAANDRRQADWDAAFRTWLRNAVKFRGETSRNPASRPPNVHDLELPPDGLTPEQYASWEFEQRQKRGLA